MKREEMDTEPAQHFIGLEATRNKKSSHKINMIFILEM